MRVYTKSNRDLYRYGWAIYIGTTKYLIALGLVVCFTPPMVGFMLIHDGQLLAGLAVLGIWLPLQAVFLRMLARREFASLWITVPSVVLVVGAFAAAIFSRH